MSETALQALRQCLATAQRVLVTSHIRPDGDAVGSLLGLGMALQAAGKDVQMVLSDGVPGNLRHLPGSNQVRRRPEGHFDLVIILDCSDLERIGFALQGLEPPDVNIDHHPTNLLFAKLNLVEVEAVATAELLAEYLPALDLSIDLAVAANLLTGIVTDTLGFRTSNMTPRALRIAAALMETGASLPDLYHDALISRSFEAALYWGAGLSKLQREGNLVWTALTLADRRAVGYPGRDDADLINVLTTLDHANIVIIFVEQSENKVKVSWRSRPGYDVSQIALRFGGGGHVAASGAEVSGNLEQVQAEVLRATRSLIDEN